MSHVAPKDRYYLGTVEVPDLMVKLDAVIALLTQVVALQQQTLEAIKKTK